MKSDSGQKLGAILHQGVINDALSSANAGAPIDLAWRAGHASGMQTTVRSLDQLAKWEEQAPATADERPTDDLSWLYGH